MEYPVEENILALILSGSIWSQSVLHLSSIIPIVHMLCVLFWSSDILSNESSSSASPYSFSTLAVFMLEMRMEPLDERQSSPPQRVIPH